MAFGPVHQRFGIEPRAQIFAGHRDILAQVKFVPKLLDQTVPLENRFFRRRDAQPVRQLVLPHWQPGGGEQLKKAASAKKVKVLRVYVRLLAKSLAGLPGPGPGVFHPRKTLAVKGCGRFNARARAEDMLVRNRERHINAERHGQPIGREPLLRERHPGQYEPGGQYSDLYVSDKDVPALLNLNGSAKSFQPRRILLRRVRHLFPRRPPVECTPCVLLGTWQSLQIRSPRQSIPCLPPEKPVSVSFSCSCGGGRSMLSS